MVEASMKCPCGNAFKVEGSIAYKYEQCLISKGWSVINKIWYCPECSKNITDSFWKLKDLEQLAKEQGVKPIDDLSKLVCPEIALDDEDLKHPDPWQPISTYKIPEFIPEKWFIPSGFVLLYSKSNGVHVGRFEYTQKGKEKWWSRKGYDIKPTHWMPLPEPPKRK